MIRVVFLIIWPVLQVFRAVLQVIRSYFASNSGRKLAILAVLHVIKAVMQVIWTVLLIN